MAGCVHTCIIGMLTAPGVSACQSDRDNTPYCFVMGSEWSAIHVFIVFLVISIVPALARVFIIYSRCNVNVTVILLVLK